MYRYKNALEEQSELVESLKRENKSLQGLLFYIYPVF